MVAHRINSLVKTQQVNEPASQIYRGNRGRRKHCSTRRSSQIRGADSSSEVLPLKAEASQLDGNAISPDSAET